MARKSRTYSGQSEHNRMLSDVKLTVVTSTADRYALTHLLAVPTAMLAKKPQRWIERCAGVRDPAWPPDSGNLNRRVPSRLYLLLDLLVEWQTLRGRDTQVLGHPTHVDIYRDGNAGYTTDLRPARVGHDPHPHRPDLGTAQHGKSVPTSAVPTLQIFSQLLRVSHAVLDHPAHRTTSRGQAVGNSAPRFGIRTVALAHTAGTKQIRNGGGGHGYYLARIENLWMRGKEFDPGAPQLRGVTRAVHSRNEGHKQAHGPV